VAIELFGGLKARFLERRLFKVRQPVVAR
jgi:hypothetical protein